MALGPSDDDEEANHTAGLANPARFDIASEEGRHGLHNHLAQHGFAIAAATATRDEIDALHSSLWDFLEAVPGTSAVTDSTPPPPSPSPRSKTPKA